MTRREWLALAATAAMRGQNALDVSGAARDLTYQALELLSAQSSKTDVVKAVSLLKGALDQDPSFGDAYYYRQLCLKRLAENAARQKLDLQAAERYESEALRDQRDPFVLAVPRIYENLGSVGQKWALVVGVSKFNPDAGAAPLQYADADASAFAGGELRDPQIGRFPDRSSVPANERSSDHSDDQGALEHDRSSR